MRVSLILGSVLVAALVTPRFAAAQTTDTYQVWGALLGSAAFDEAPPRLKLWMDVHSRRGSGGTVLIVRPAVGYQLSPWLTLWGGYAWVPTFNDAQGTASHEHRIWQQATLSHAYDSGLSIQSRTRFEQRFSDQGDDVALRLRQFVRLNYQPDPDQPLGLAFWDEIFLGVTRNDWSAPRGFDQNRIFVGPFLKMADQVRLEAGYLFAFVKRGPAKTLQHVLAINIFYSL